MKRRSLVPVFIENAIAGIDSQDAAFAGRHQECNLRDKLTLIASGQEAL